METSHLEDLISKIDNLPDELLSIKKQAKKYLKNNSIIDNLETINIFHRPWVARFNWSLMFYKGADNTWFGQYEKMTQKSIPDFYKNFLSVINGCFIHGISLYGLTPSIYTKGTLDRSVLQSHDLTTANNEWIKEYEVDQRYFHFGGRSFSSDENLGYFFYDDKIMAIRKNGNVINEWTSYFEFLFNEIVYAEQATLKKIPDGVTVLINE
jgi:hypothetical protein